MKTLMKSSVRPSTVKLVGRQLSILVDTGVVPVSEYHTVMSNLRYLSHKGELLPDIKPKLLTQKEVAAMLSISFANFRSLERDGHFPFKRKMVGTSVRYYNTDIIKYILALGDEKAPL